MISAVLLYICVVLTGVHLIDANDAPKLTPFVRVINQSEGTKFRMFCGVHKGFNPIYFNWARNGHILTPKSDAKYKIEISDEHSFLIISNISRADAANYTCIARNSFGTDAQSVMLSVRVTPKWVKEPRDIRINAGDSAYAECIADGFPKPSIKWFGSRGDVITGSILKLSKHSLTANARYECVADNGIGEPLRKAIAIYLTDIPQIIRLSHPEKPYVEGSKFKYFCSINSGSRPLFFSWMKNGVPLSQQNNIIIKTDDTMETSLLGIDDIAAENAGNYTCLVRNAFGSDSYTVGLNVYVPSKWTEEPQNISAKYGSSIDLKCDADGIPPPKIMWRRVSDNNDIFGKSLSLTRVNASDAGVYECIVRSSSDNSDKIVLRKVITIKIHVPAKFDEKYTMIQVKKGESARLKCNATGDQPLSISWTKDNIKLDKIGGNNFEIIDCVSESGLVSELILRSTQRIDGAIYKCDAENEHGKDERTIKLVVVEVPERPTNVRVKEVWSKTASVVWSPPYSGNFPLSKYTVQYWRHKSAPQRLYELSVSSSQTSVMIKDLSPGLSYELSVVGENEVGRGQASDSVTFTTGEEEPSAPPNDITVEPIGPTTVRVTWRPPPLENWNGAIKGYYIGYRKTRDTSHPYTLKLVESKQRQTEKYDETEIFEYFLRDLAKGTDYFVIVKAYNSAGSGPQSREAVAHTKDGDYPPPQQLSSIDSDLSTISLRWYQRDTRAEVQTPVVSYAIHYQRDGDPQWREIPVTAAATEAPVSAADASPVAVVGTYSYVLQNLEPGTQYKIFITAVNRFGFSDPSNIVTTKTDGDRKLSMKDLSYPLYEESYYFQPSFTIPVLTAIVIIVIVFIIAFICVRKIRRSSTDGLILDSATLGKQFAGYTGTAPRYMDFDKTGAKPLMMTEQGNMFPTPYATMPMGGTQDEMLKPWERPLPTFKKDGHHIYDHPQ